MHRFLRHELLFVAVVAGFAAGAASADFDAAAACRATSGARVTPLIELYTSEGCDSCPPAERWLSASFASGDEHPAAIALAFHVDYWDRLGWIDRFARPEYTARQYAAVRAGASPLAYTPQVLLQGHDVGCQRTDRTAIEALARRPADATLTLSAIPTERDVTVQVRAQAAPGSHPDAVVDVAYADSGLVSDVAAGENRGARLVHDHVVRSLVRAGRVAGGRLAATLVIAKPRERGTHPTLVALVWRESNVDVLQALALPLAGCALR